jgi:hypothetical protein
MAFVKLDTPLHNLLLKILGESSKEYIRLSLNWSAIVGEYLACNSYVTSIEDKTLFIGVSNGVVRQELSLLKKELLKKISKELKIKLKDIVLYVKDDAVKN